MSLSSAGSKKLTCQTDSSNINSSGIAFTGGSGLRFYTYYKSSAAGHEDVAADTIERMIINNDGDVGIGTTDPGKKLHVEGAMQVGGNAVTTSTSPTTSVTNYYYATIDTDSNGYAGYHSTLGGPFSGLVVGPEIYLRGSDIQFFSGATKTKTGGLSMFVKRGGNVGIGTTDPKKKLHVNGVIKVDATVGYNTLQGHMQIADNMDNAHFRFGSETTKTTSSPIALLRSAPSDNAKNALLVMNYNSQFPRGTQIDSNLEVNGYVGIGTATPAAKLTVFGTVIYDSQHGNILTLRNSNKYNPIVHDSTASNYATSRKLNNETGTKHGSCFLQIDTMNPTTLTHTHHTAGTVTRKAYFGIPDIGSTDIHIRSEFNSKATGATGDPDTGAHINIQNENLVVDCVNNTVGIGTNTPEAKLHVKGHVLKDITSNFTGSNFGASVGNAYVNVDLKGMRIGTDKTATDGTTNHNISILSSNSIAANGTLFSYSDRRIKTNIEDVPDDLALRQIRDIPCRYYEYIDKVEKKAGKTIGFIAQEVKEILPMAVSKLSDFIPDVYKLLENVSWNESMMNDAENNAIKMSCELKDVGGIKYRFYVSDLEDNSNEVELEIVGNEDNTFTFEKKWKYVFCYGKKINDLNIIDKQKIFALHHSAIQELDKTIEEGKQKTAELESKVTELQNENSQLKSQMEVILQRLAALENKN